MISFISICIALRLRTKNNRAPDRMMYGVYLNNLSNWLKPFCSHSGLTGAKTEGNYGLKMNASRIMEEKSACRVRIDRLP